MAKTKKLQEEVIEYFTDYDVEFPLTGDSTTESPYKFSFKAFRKEHGLTKMQAVTFLCNLEDTSVMNEIAEGKYDGFSISDSTLFNDSYHEMYENLLKG
jgi:hypothetical protein